jgi:hypothetical protein
MSPQSTPRGRAYTAAEPRLELVDDVLLVAGWTRDDPGAWHAPQHLSEFLAEHVGRGAVRRWVAIAAQVQFDEQLAAITEATGSTT